MKRALPYIIFYFILIMMAFGPILSEYSYLYEDINLDPNDYARITDMDYKAVLVDEPDSKGKVVITERITFDVHAASPSNPFWELWRDLCEDYVDGLKVHYKVNSVKQIFPNGKEVIYEESPKLYWEDEDYLSSNRRYGPQKWFHSPGPYSEYNARYECVFFYVDGIYREEMVFEIEYEMYNAALKYNDCSDLYLNMFSEDSVYALESFKAEILIPNADMPRPGNYLTHTYGTNANDFPISESATKNPGYYTFFFELNEEQLNFKPYNEYIEFELVSFGEDKHIFTDYAPDNYYTYDDVLSEVHDEQRAYDTAPARFRLIKICILGAMILGSIALFFYCRNTETRMRSKHVFWDPTMEMEYYRDIPSDLDPNFAAALVFCKQKPPKDDSGVYSAILLSLARKKYITLDEMGFNNVLITVRYTPPKPEPLTVATDIGNVPVHETSALYSTYLESMAAAETVSTPADNPTEIFANDTTLDTASDTVVAPEPVETFEPLTPCEQYYFDLIVRHAVNNEILMNQLQFRVSNDYSNTDTFVRNMERSIVNIGIKEGYFQKADYAQPKRELKKASTTLLVIGILFITLVNIICYNTRIDLAFGAFFLFGIACIIASVYLKKQAPKYVLLTQFGEDEYAKWRGLYNFLNSETLIHERSFVELAIWEKYLVYATAFGLPDKVISAISIRCPEIATDTTTSSVLSKPYYRSRSFHHAGRSFRSAVRSGSSVARGGGFGGFGYGGGGRGGGGGGGGH